MAVLYLEPDDEITGAVARLRAMSETQVVLVVPAGSRIGTSRINFRLLAREADRRSLRLATVSDEAQVRAMAGAAGLSAYTTVDAAESALAAAPAPAGPRTSPAAGATAVLKDAPGTPAGEAASSTAAARSAIAAPTAGSPSGAAGQDGAAVLDPPRTAARDDETRVLRVPAETAPPRLSRAIEPPTYEPEATPRARRRRRGRLLAPLLAMVLLFTLVGLGAYAAYLFVPTAEITLQPRLVEIGPVAVTVTADPAVAVVDVGAGLIPAQRIDLPVSVEGQYEASGTTVTLASASGTVRFRSENTLLEVPVPAGTVVSTPAGIEFRTLAGVTVPRAVFNASAGTVNVAVEAVRAGPRGNVAANSITRLPDQLAGLLISVRNPQRTSGGQRTERTVVTQDDYDAALADLNARLIPALSAALDDPATTPRGLTLYRHSARLGPPTADQAPSALVDQPMESFELALSATATVLAVNEQLVDEVADRHLRDRIPAGATLLEPTITTTHPPGTVRGGTIVFSASGVAQSYRPPDRDELLAEIRGQPLAEARAIMERYGSAEIVIWPDFIDRVPDQLGRINLIVQPPAETP